MPELGNALVELGYISVKFVSQGTIYIYRRCISTVFLKYIYDLCTNPLGYGYFLLTSSIISVFTIWTGPKLHLQKHLPTNHSFPVAHPVIYFIYKLESVGG